LIDYFIKLSDEDYHKCRKFAEDCDIRSKKDYVYGVMRNQPYAEKRIRDHTNGKMCELAAHRIFERHGLKTSEPSFEVLKKPTWDCDLESDDYRIHVKGQSHESVSKYGKSWTFQVGNKYGSYGKDPIYAGPYDDKDLVAFCSIGVDMRTVTVDALVPVPDLHKNKLFTFVDGEDLPHLKGIKLFVRYEHEEASSLKRCIKDLYFQIKE
jgi:hypothetical protein